MKEILFICAMKKEAIIITQKLGMEKINENLYRKDNITLLISGIGKQRTAISLSQYLCNNKKPELVINVGYAGSTDINVGEWVNITKSYNYEWEIPGEEKYSFQDYGNKNLMLINEPDIQKVECYSSESFVTSTKLEGHIAFDMELHSVTVICDMYEIPVMSLKKISDNLNIDNYYENIANNNNVFELDSCLKFLPFI